MDAAAPAIVTRQPGTYALILHARSQEQIIVGRWGTLDVVPGYYIYVGSAFGPGGVSARIQRHCREDKKRRWHIDFLREVTTPVQAWCSFSGRDLEHRWAGFFSRQRLFPHGGGLTAIPDFGCSDCRCESHLFATSSVPDLQRFGVLAGKQAWVWKLQSVGDPGPSVETFDLGNAR